MTSLLTKLLLFGYSSNAKTPDNGIWTSQFYPFEKQGITEDMVFDKEGNFIPEKIDEEGNKTEGGKELLKRKFLNINFLVPVSSTRASGHITL